MFLGESAIIGSNWQLPFKKTPTKPKNTLNKKIPKGFGIFLKRLVRTSALPTAPWFWISKMPFKLRKNTMSRRFAPRLPTLIFRNVILGGDGGIRTPDDFAAIPVFKTGPFNRSGTSPCEARAGIEPAHRCFADTCVSSSPTRRVKRGWNVLRSAKDFYILP